MALHASTERVAQYISERSEQADENDIDWIAGLSAQMSLLMDQMGAAISDWRELLPEDYEEARSAAAAMREINSRLEAIERLQGGNGWASEGRDRPATQGD